MATIDRKIHQLNSLLAQYDLKQEWFAITKTPYIWQVKSFGFFDVQNYELSKALDQALDVMLSKKREQARAAPAQRAKELPSAFTKNRRALPARAAQVYRYLLEQPNQEAPTDKIVNDVDAAVKWAILRVLRDLERMGKVEWKAPNIWKAIPPPMATVELGTVQIKESAPVTQLAQLFSRRHHVDSVVTDE